MNDGWFFGEWDKHPIDRRLGERDKFRVIPGPFWYLVDVEIAERKSNRLVYSRQKQRQTREALWCKGWLVQGQGIRAIEQSGFLVYESSVHREVRARTRIRMIAGQAREPNTQLYFHSSYLFLPPCFSPLLPHHWLSNWIRRSRMRGIKLEAPSRFPSTRVNDDARTLCGERRAKLPSAQVTFLAYS